MRLKRKIYTQYDDTDRLKQMKDSDILAEKKRSAPGFGQVAGAAATGVIAGGTVGALAGGIRGGLKRGHTMLGGAGKWGKIGAVASGAVLGTIAARNRNKEAKENKFYNDRLEYAQKQALRREKKDWKQNMTQRESYTY